MSEEAESRVASLLIEEVVEEECTRLAEATAKESVEEWKEETQ